MKFISLSILLVCLTASRLGAAEAERPAAERPRVPKPVFADKIIARGKGVEVSQSQVDDMYLSFKAHRAAMGVRVPETMRPRIEADILEKLIATQLFLQLATDEDRGNAKQIAEDFIAEQIKQAPSKESFVRQLLAVGMSEEQYRAQILEQAVVKSVIDREIKGKKTVSDGAIKAYFDQNAVRFKDPEMVRVSQILVSTHDPKTGQPLGAEQMADKKRVAERILARAKAGEDFKLLVTLFSDDAPSKQRAGEYTITRAADDSNRAAVPEFEAAAFSLKEGQVSDVVTTRSGYHILKLIERIPARPLDFGQVQSKIKEKLLQDEVQKELPTFIDAMKKRAGVEIVSAVPQP
jgi:parvulin-like peptidyl-prolyl isomerase